MYLFCLGECSTSYCVWMHARARAFLLVCCDACSCVDSCLEPLPGCASAFSPRVHGALLARLRWLSQERNSAGPRRGTIPERRSKTTAAVARGRALAAAPARGRAPASALARASAPPAPGSTANNNSSKGAPVGTVRNGGSGGCGGGRGGRGGGFDVSSGKSCGGVAPSFPLYFLSEPLSSQLLPPPPRSVDERANASSSSSPHKVCTVYSCRCVAYLFRPRSAATCVPLQT